MTELQRLQELLDRTYAGNNFFGDSIAAIFSSLDIKSATWKPEGAAHSSWQILLHMTNWLNVIRQRLTSATLVTLSDDDNYPPSPEPTLGNLSRSLDAFRDAVTQLKDALNNFPAEKLEQPVPGRGYPFSALLHGAIHHSIYHAGQISLLNAMYRRQHTKG